MSIPSSNRFVVLAALVLISGCASGRVKVATPGMQVELTDWWGSTVQVTSEMGETLLPAGIYKTESILISAKDNSAGAGAKDAVWTMTSYRDFGNLSHVTVRSEQTTVLSGGPPLRIEVVPRKQENEVAIGINVYGQAGESYFPGAVRDERRQAAPSIKITDQDAKVLDEGTFRFG